MIPARRQKPDAHRDSLGSIRTDEVLPLAVFKRRLGVGNRTISQMQRDGLRTIPYGRGKWVLGKDFFAWADGLGVQQDRPEPVGLEEVGQP